MKLKDYITLSNLEASNHAPCYLSSISYFMKKIEGGDEKTYYFLHNRKKLKNFVNYFGIESDEEKIKKLIKAKKTDNEIFNEISALSPANIDIDSYLSGDVVFYGNIHVTTKYPYKTISELGQHDIIVITLAKTGYIDEIRIDTLKKHAKKVYRLGYYCGTLEDQNFLDFIISTLKKHNLPNPGIHCIHTPNDGLIKKNITKNPLHLKLIEL